MGRENLRYIDKNGKEVKESFPPDKIEEELKKVQKEEFERAQELLKNLKPEEADKDKKEKEWRKAA